MSTTGQTEDNGIKNILTEQANYPLWTVLRELRWGRPAWAQKWLTAAADDLEGAAREGAHD